MNARFAPRCILASWQGPRLSTAERWQQLFGSACNTAAEEKPGAKALSSLARAFFFYAGARSLIVSHWNVSDEATVG